MSIWFKDVEEYDGARGATKNGMIAALAFAAMIALSAVILGVTGELPNQPAGPESLALQVGGLALEAAIVLLAAWRFWIGKGWLSGSIVLLLFVIEVGVKLFGGFAGIFWYVVYLAIFVGMVNGVRGAWALRAMSEHPEDLSDTFA